MTKLDPLTLRIRDAAIQMRYMQPWLEDRNFEAEGGSFIYAVDADIFRVYGDPHSSAGVRLGRVFHDDDQELSSALARRLTDFTFFGADAERPKLVVPPIDAEVTSILQGLIKDFGNEPPPTTVDFDELKGNLERLRAAGVGSDHDEIYENILKYIYLETGSAATYRTLSRLILLDRIVGPDAASKAYANVAGLGGILRPFKNIGQIIEHIELRDKWLKRFHRSPSPRRTTEHDAECLARIEIWNSQLEEARVRILYVTATNYIHDAVLRYGPHALSFIRHPRYFLASNDLFRDVRAKDPPSGESAFLGWLTTLLGSYGNVDRFEANEPFTLNTRFVSEITRAKQNDPEASVEMQERWAEFTREFREAYRPPQIVQQRIVEEVGTKLNGVTTIREWEALRDDLDEQIRQSTAEAWNACFLIAARTGFAVNTFDSAKTVARTVPPIYFDSWPKTREFVRKVSRWHRPEDFNAEEYRQGLLDVESEERSGYAYYLAHAALFAGRGEWPTAAALCDQAISIAPGAKGVSGTQANGREALYLAGYSRRQVVNSKAELDGLYVYVERARQIYEKEQSDRPGLDAIGERFESERLSIELTRVFFDWYLEAKGSQDASALAHRADRIFGSLVELQIRLKGRIALLSSEAGQDSQRRLGIARRLLVRVSANVLSLGLTRLERRSSDDPGFIQAFSNVSEYVDSANDEAEEVRRSYFVKSVLITTKAILRDPQIRRKNIVDHFARSKDGAVFPYDEARFRHWERISLSGG